MGDIHGAYKALRQCLERSSFDKDKDVLIQLGHVADGFEQVYDCVEELLKIRNLISIKGNHDEWLNQFILTGYHPMDWAQGGAASALSYVRQIGRKKKLPGTWSGDQIALNPAIIQFRMVTEFNHIFIGHTSTIKWKTDKPMKAANIYNLDTGAGCAGRLTMMDIEPKKFWQSDPVRKLYCR